MIGGVVMIRGLIFGGLALVLLAAILIIIGFGLLVTVGSWMLAFLISGVKFLIVPALIIGGIWLIAKS